MAGSGLKTNGTTAKDQSLSSVLSQEQYIPQPGQTPSLIDERAGTLHDVLMTPDKGELRPTSLYRLFSETITNSGSGAANQVPISCDVIPERWTIFMVASSTSTTVTLDFGTGDKLTLLVPVQGQRLVLPAFSKSMTITAVAAAGFLYYVVVADAGTYIDRGFEWL